MDGNEATATVAFAMSEVSFIYPITPSSTVSSRLCHACLVSSTCQPVVAAGLSRTMIGNKSPPSRHAISPRLKGFAQFAWISSCRLQLAGVCGCRLRVTGVCVSLGRLLASHVAVHPDAPYQQRRQALQLARLRAPSEKVDREGLSRRLRNASK